MIGGEFIFIPRDESAAEGEGWLMGLVIDAKAKRLSSNFSMRSISKMDR